MKVYYFIFIILFFASCNIEDEAIINGVKIGNTLYEQKGALERYKLSNLIERSLNLDSTAFRSLINYDCGRAAGCYDLGSIIAQIARIKGELNFLKMIENYNKEEKLSIKEFLEVGLQYGKKLNPQKENQKLELEFPKIYIFLLE